MRQAKRMASALRKPKAEDKEVEPEDTPEISEAPKDTKMEPSEETKEETAEETNEEIKEEPKEEEGELEEEAAKEPKEEKEAIKQEPKEKRRPKLLPTSKSKPENDKNKPPSPPPYVPESLIDLMAGCPVSPDSDMEKKGRKKRSKSKGSKEQEHKKRKPANPKGEPISPAHVLDSSDDEGKTKERLHSASMRALCFKELRLVQEPKGPLVKEEQEVPLEVRDKADELMRALYKTRGLTWTSNEDILGAQAKCESNSSISMKTWGASEKMSIR